MRAEQTHMSIKNSGSSCRSFKSCKHDEELRANKGLKQKADRIALRSRAISVISPLILLRLRALSLLLFSANSQIILVVFLKPLQKNPCIIIVTPPTLLTTNLH